MRLTIYQWAMVILAVCGFSALPGHAQQHRATHLGNPATRFAPPLKTPEDLRARFRDPRLRPDFAAVLNQWGWKGDLDDLFRAAATARISEVKVPPGTRLPFMSSREKGRAIALRDVLWAGKEPFDAYVFVFSSKGQRYRCLTPKACSNFLLIDLGPEVAKLELEVRAPADAASCEPVPLRVLVRNAGHAPLTGVEVRGDLPPCLRAAEGQASLSLRIPSLRAGEVREFRYNLLAAGPGSCSGVLQATSAEGAKAEARYQTRIRAPVLELECAVPAEVPIGRPVEVCLSVRNAGNAPESAVVLALASPAGAVPSGITGGGRVAGGQVVWEVASLAPGASESRCVTFVASDPTAFAFEASARGACAAPVETRCASRVSGVPGILLEVVDVADPVEVGGEVVYEIRVTNQGSVALTQVRPVCTVSELQEFVSGSGTTLVGPPQERILTLEPVATLAAKAVASWRVVTKATAQGNALFRVDLICDELPRGVIETETTNQY